MKKLLTVLLTVLIAFTTITFNVVALENESTTEEIVENTTPVNEDIITEDVSKEDPVEEVKENEPLVENVVEEIPTEVVEEATDVGLMNETSVLGESLEEDALLDSPTRTIYQRVDSPTPGNTYVMVDKLNTGSTSTMKVNVLTENSGDVSNTPDIQVTRTGNDDSNYKFYIYDTLTDSELIYANLGTQQSPWYGFKRVDKNGKEYFLETPADNSIAFAESADKTKAEITIAEKHVKFVSGSRNIYFDNTWKATQYSGGKSAYLYEKKTVDAIEVTFNANEGLFSDGEKSKKEAQIEGATYYFPKEEPVRDGYMFVGWYTDPTNGIEKHEDDVFDKSFTTLYAHWANLVTYEKVKETSRAKLVESKESFLVVNIQGIKGNEKVFVMNFDSTTNATTPSLVAVNATYVDEDTITIAENTAKEFMVGSETITNAPARVDYYLYNNKNAIFLDSNNKLTLSNSLGSYNRINIDSDFKVCFYETNSFYINYLSEKNAWYADDKVQYNTYLYKKKVSTVATAGPVENLAYTGEEITSPIEVTVDGVALDSSKYTVSFAEGVTVKNAGVYSATVQLNDDNYYFLDETGKQTDTVTIEFEVAKAKVVCNSEAFVNSVYDGTEKPLGNYITVKFNETELTEGEDYNIYYCVGEGDYTLDKPKNADRYDSIARLDEDGNYYFYIDEETSKYIYDAYTTSLTIYPKEVTATIEDKYIKPIIGEDGKEVLDENGKPLYYCTYDGNKYTPETVSFDGVLKDESLNYQIIFTPIVETTNEKPDPKPEPVEPVDLINAGRYTMTIAIVESEDGIRNYCFDNQLDDESSMLTYRMPIYFDDYSIEVQQAQVTITIPNHTYDENEYKPIDNLNFKLTFKDRNGKDVVIDGTTDKGKETLKSLMANGYLNWEGQYRDSNNKQVTPKEVGKYHTTLIVGRINVSPVGDGNFYIDEKDGVKNYNATVEFEITENIKKVNPVIVSSMNLTYDGTNKIKKLSFDCTGDDVADNDIVTIVKTTHQTFVGEWRVNEAVDVDTYTTYLKLKDTEKYAWDTDKVKVVKDWYTGEEYAVVTWSIIPKRVQVSIKNKQEITYGDSITFSYDDHDGFVGRDELGLNFKYYVDGKEYRGQKLDAKDEYQIYVEITNKYPTNNVLRNYRINTVIGTLKVNKAPLTVTFVNNSRYIDKTYDGEVFAPELVFHGLKYGEKLEEATINWKTLELEGDYLATYYDKDGYENTKNAGDKAVDVGLITSETNVARNYELVGSTIEKRGDSYYDVLYYAIAPKHISVTWDKELVYNGYAQAPEFIVEDGGIVKGDDYTINTLVMNPNHTDVGRYMIYPSGEGKDANNYLIDLPTAIPTFEITPYELHLIWSTKTKFVKHSYEQAPYITDVEFMQGEDTYGMQGHDESLLDKDVYIMYQEGFGPQIHTGKYTAKVELTGPKAKNYTIKEGDEQLAFKIYRRTDEDTTPVKTGVDR
ncbi:MAG: InlB B-repeat-containing protein [Erysipelotrichaceae bacterium]|nr:InlB B-repeat-containing protein [Erysipelotrichaceae bacterium]